MNKPPRAVAAAPSPRSSANPPMAVISPLPSTDGLSFAESMYNALRRSIVEGELDAGARLRETELAERFGVSRTPVREALKKLEAEGLVVDLPGRGLTVSKPSLNEILDAYLVREEIEGLATRLAAERALETEILRLEAIVRQLREAHATDSVERLVELSNAFDDVLFQAARSPLLYKTIEAARASQGTVRRGNLRDPVRRAESVVERAEILDAVRKRQGEAAERATQMHLRRAREHRMALSLEEADPGA